MAAIAFSTASAASRCAVVGIAPDMPWPPGAEVDVSACAGALAAPAQAPSLEKRV